MPNPNFLDHPKTDPNTAPAPRWGASQDVAYNAAGGALVQAKAFAATTQMIEVATKPSSTATGIRVSLTGGPPGSVGTSNKLIPPGAVVYARVYGGEVLSVISDDGNAGVCNVTECV